MIDDELREKVFTKFRTYLRENQLKVTKEREIILTEVLKRTDHFDADELAADLRGAQVRVSRATVYRTLDILYDLNFVSKSTLGHKHQHYENMVGRAHHDHLVCNQCDKVIEFVNDDIERLQHEVCKNLGFKMTSHTLQIFGICRDCIAKNNELS